MDEISSSSGFTFSKKEVIRYGLNTIMQPTISGLMHVIESKLIALVASELTDQENRYKFTLTVNKI